MQLKFKISQNKHFEVAVTRRLIICVANAFPTMMQSKHKAASGKKTESSAFLFLVRRAARRERVCVELSTRHYKTLIWHAPWLGERGGDIVDLRG